MNNFKKHSIPWFQPELSGSELSNLKSVLDSNFLNDGPLTSEFENRIASYIGVTCAVAVPSGTVALSLALMALGVGPGDEVIVPNLTFIATANAVRMVGAVPVLVDVNLHRFTVNPDAVLGALNKNTRAIIAVDVNGRGADYGFLEQFCRDKNLYLLCDSAEALGSKYCGKYLGSFGDVAALSFSANKTVTTGQGGMILTNNQEIAERVRQLKDQGRLKRGSGGDDLHPTLGFNFKYTDIQAAVGLAQFDLLEKRCKHAAQRDSWYREMLAGLPGLNFPDYDSQPGEVRQWTDVLIDNRDDVRFRMTQRGIGNRAFWHPIHTQQPYSRDSIGFENSIYISNKGLWLPSYFSLTYEEVEFVAEFLKGLLRANN